MTHIAPRHHHLLPLLLACTACSTLDPDVGPKLHAYTLRVGAELIADFNSELRLDSENLGSGTSIDLEDDLGLESSTAFARVDLELRFDRRNAVELAYYNIERSSARVLGQDIQFGENLFPEGASVAVNDGS